MREIITVPVTPVPVRLAVWGLPAALSATLSVPLRVPVAVGVKVTLTVQLALAARVEGLKGQLLVWAKSPLLAPVIETLVMVSAELPLLVRVTA